MGGCCCGETKPIEVYVELAGKQDYHVTLKGRDEADQHPISAITNLQDNLDEIQDNLAEIETQVDEERQRIDNIHIENYYDKDEIDDKVYGAFHYKGQVTDYISLPIVGNAIGDVYNTVDTGANYVWTGNSWDNLSPIVGLEDYVIKEYFEGSLDASIKLLQDHLKVHYYEKSEIDTTITDVNDSISGLSDNINSEVARLDQRIDDLSFELTNAFIYQGSVNTFDDLPITANIGYVYHIQDTKDIYFWDGNKYTLLEQGVIIDTYSKDEIDNLLSTKADASDAEEMQDQVDALSQNLNKLKDDLEAVKIWYDLSDVINS